MRKNIVYESELRLELSYQKCREKMFTRDEEEGRCLLSEGARILFLINLPACRTRNLWHSLGSR